MSKSKFEQNYKNIDDKINFLKSFDLPNLQKAGCIGLIPLNKMTKKSQAIKSIIDFDIKNKFLISKTIFENLDEYHKNKNHNNSILKTIELEELNSKNSSLNKSAKNFDLDNIIEKKQKNSNLNQSTNVSCNKNQNRKVLKKILTVCKTNLIYEKKQGFTKIDFDNKLKSLVDEISAIESFEIIDDIINRKRLIVLKGQIK